jgi:hypothetical protein
MLFQKVSPDMPRSLIGCIGRFKDKEEVPRLREWLGCDKDFAQPAAFSVLCQLDPETALVAVEELADENAALTFGYRKGPTKGCSSLLVSAVMAMTIWQTSTRAMRI